jgi:Raf kinase inhibitor-like YbhB/YbcL family protein
MMMANTAGQLLLNERRGLMDNLKRASTTIGLPESAQCITLALLLAIALIAGGRRADSVAAAAIPATLALTSANVQDGRIPKQFTCDGADSSPALTWAAPPATTASLALIMTDPDAPGGTFVHWVLYDLPATKRELASGIPKQAQLNDGARQGRNDFGNLGYGGPCPPPGRPHRYVFELYALDTKLGLAPGGSRKQVEDAAEGHILARGELTARYGR